MNRFKKLFLIAFERESDFGISRNETQLEKVYEFYRELLVEMMTQFILNEDVFEAMEGSDEDVISRFRKFINVKFPKEQE
jgi:hypothetical protein